MNTSADKIAQVVESIGLMYQALAALRQETLPINPRLFAVMAEGPIDQMRDLLDQLDNLLAAGPTESEALETEREDALQQH